MTPSRLPLMILVFAIGGCTGQAATTAPDASRGDRQAAGQLYSGQPAIVHATEFPVASAAEGVARGDEAWRQGKLDLAVYLYVQSLAFDATDAGPFLKIGAIHERLGNRALAEKAFELALERAPDNAAALERLGLLYLQSKRDDEAAAMFERALALDANRWQSHNGLGIAADRRHDFTAAVLHYDKALQLAPGAAAVVNNRGYSRYLAGDLAGAEADVKEAIRLGALAGAWMNLGEVQAKQKRYPEALESFLKEAGVADAYNLLGEFAMANRDYSAAQDYFKSAIGASPRYFEAAQKNLALANERLANPVVPVAPVASVAIANGYGVYWGPSVDRRGQARKAQAIDGTGSGRKSAKRRAGSNSTP